MPHIPYVFLTSVILVSRVFAPHAHLRHLRCLGGRCSYIVCFPAYSRRTLTFDTFGVSVSVARTLSAFQRIRDERSPSTPSVPRCPLHSHSPLFWHVRTCKQPGRAKWRTAFVAHTLIVSQSVFVVKKMLPDFYGRRYRYPPLPGGSAPAGSAVLPQRLP